RPLLPLSIPQFRTTKSSARTTKRMRSTSRRRLLQFLAASPLLGGATPSDFDKLIDDPKQALDVFDFEPVARKNLPPAHFGYLATGVDDEVTLHANRAAFQHYQLRPRRLVDVSKIDMRTTLFGVAYDSPIFICPTGSNKAFHPDGEVAVAQAAKAG